MRALVIATLLVGCWRGSAPPVQVTEEKPRAPAPRPRAPEKPPGERVGLDAPVDVDAPPLDAKVTAKGVAYKVLFRGGSRRRPTGTDIVKVHYTGWTTDGNMIDSSVKRGVPAEFPLTAVIPGWTDGLQQAAVGDTIRLWIPESLAYKGRPHSPQGMLVFDVELLDIVVRP
jgi:peptidylprolyl isomerase